MIKRLLINNFKHLSEIKNSSKFLQIQIITSIYIDIKSSQIAFMAYIYVPQSERP